MDRIVIFGSDRFLRYDNISFLFYPSKYDTIRRPNGRKHRKRKYGAARVILAVLVKRRWGPHHGAAPSQRTSPADDGRSRFIADVGQTLTISLPIYFRTVLLNVQKN